MASSASYVPLLDVSQQEGVPATPTPVCLETNKSPPPKVAPSASPVQSSGPPQKEGTAIDSEAMKVLPLAKDAQLAPPHTLVPPQIEGKNDSYDPNMLRAISCPISRQIFKDPVLLPSGHSVERSV